MSLNQTRARSTRRLRGTSIVDVKARDDQEVVFHIEIQLSTPSGLVKRMVFYGCELYADQLRDGDSYTQLRPIYSICLLDGIGSKGARKGNKGARNLKAK